MNGDMNEQAVQVTWKATELTAKGLQALIQTLLENRNRIEHGEQSLKKLNLQGKQLESVKLTDNDIKHFKKELNRYAVDFNVKRDKISREFVVFFKGQDVDRIYQGLESCIKGLDKNLVGKKPIKEVMEAAAQKAEERAANRPAPEKVKSAERGQEI